MRITIFSFILFASLAYNTTAQTSFFKQEELVKTGVYYYPEQWDKTQWDRDFRNMKSLGFGFTHFAEFAWAMLEPDEGKYDFTWLDEAVRLAKKNGLKVIMCTPTAAPPVWLTQKYPEVLIVKEDGIRAKHGGREHYSWSSAKYWELSEKIILQMAKHYGNDSTIIGWQIDNEPSHYGTVDYGEEVLKHFQSWLQKKYTSIDSLNIAWGTSFWSQRYASFNQIILPNAKTNVQSVNPHARLDFQRFNALECSKFVSFQARLLKQQINTTQWVTTNFMQFHSKVDPWLNDKDLDFLAYTIYPVSGGYTNMGAVGEQGFRMGSPTKIAFANDFFRYKKKFTAVMELQPGQINWGIYNPQTYPGIIRAWLWSAYTGGCKLICSYRYRQPLFGDEQYHYGMVTSDGVTPNVGGREYSQFMQEIQTLRTHFTSNAQMPKDYANRKTAILWNWDNYWDTEILPETYKWNPAKVIFKFHRSLKELNCPVDFISEDMDFANYPTIVAPMYQLVDDKLIDKLTTYVNNGGHLVLTARAGQKDRNGHLWELPYGKKIEALTGNKLLFFDLLPDDKLGSISINNQSFSWNNWADVLEPLAGTETIATFTNQFYSSKAAATSKKMGKGTVSYIGVDTDDGKFEKAALAASYKKARINLNSLPDGLMVDWRDGFWVAVNYSSDNIPVDIPKNAKIIFGNQLLGPAEVVVWK